MKKKEKKEKKERERARGGDACIEKRGARDGGGLDRVSAADDPIPPKKRKGL